MREGEREGGREERLQNDLTWYDVVVLGFFFLKERWACMCVDVL